MGYLIIVLVSAALTAMIYCWQLGLDSPITLLGFGFSTFVALAASYSRIRASTTSFQTKAGNFLKELTAAGVMLVTKRNPGGNESKDGVRDNQDDEFECAKKYYAKISRIMVVLQSERLNERDTR